jgi:hypothetical protein
MHKFTSRDVPTSGGYLEKATDIEIQQSHSYEIKGENFNQFQPHENAQKHYQQGQAHKQQVYEDPVPVIVLRVPGPAKYAVHLQNLLQQYLEIRAAQFLKVLEEQEHAQHQQSSQQANYHQHQQQQAHEQYVQQEEVAYIPMITVPMYQQVSRTNFKINFVN